MQFDIRDELNDGLVLLKKEVLKYDEEISLVSGEVNVLTLNQLWLLPDGAKANLGIEGRIKLMS